MVWFSVSVFAAVIAVTAAAAVAAGALVDTANGPVSGSFNAAENVYAFKGIPYADPPTGSNRLRPTTPVSQNWTTPLNATAFSPGCISRVCIGVGFQIPYICPAQQSEDCLYLNVWVPANATTPLPVLVFIHGGGFIMGSASAGVFDGSVLSGRNNVIVVTFNYRLGPLGGLFLGLNTSVEGNFQLQDQLQALRWVQQNIAAFGGDPNRVTVSGESAGATSALLLLLCPAAQGLFQGAISDSHAFASRLLTPAEAVRASLQLAAAAGCAAGTSEDIADCLRTNATALTIMTPLVFDETATFWPDGLFDLLPKPFNAPFDLVWAPTRQTPLVPGEYFDQIEKGALNRVPVLLGTNANETALFMVPTGINGSVALDSITKKFRGSPEIVSELLTLYGVPPEDDAAMYVSKLATEYLFTCSNRRAAQLLTAVVPTYLYVFDYFVSMNSKYCHTEHVCHGSDLAPLFSPPSYGPESQADVHAAASLQAVWATFATWGVPITNSSANSADGVWNQFDLIDQTWMNVSVAVRPAEGFRETACDFFDAVGYFY
jgi:para-nitrobenzyl esterase